jgi:hypothetical protein
MLLLVLLIVLIAAALWFLSGQAGEVPTQTVEVEVNAPADAR